MFSCRPTTLQHVVIDSFRYQTCQVVAVFGRHLHSSCSFRHTVWQPLAVARFLLQLQSSGTLCLSMSSHHHLSQPFANGWRHILVLTVIFRHHHLALLIILSWTSKWLTYCYSSHVKNIWLVDWLIELCTQIKSDVKSFNYRYCKYLPESPRDV